MIEISPSYGKACITVFFLEVPAACLQLELAALKRRSLCKAFIVCMFYILHAITYETILNNVATEMEVNIVSVGNCDQNVLFKFNCIYGLVGWLFVSHVKYHKKIVDFTIRYALLSRIYRNVFKSRYDSRAR